MPPHDKWIVVRLICDRCYERWGGAVLNTKEYARCPKCGHWQPLPFIDSEGKVFWEKFIDIDDL